MHNCTFFNQYEGLIDQNETYLRGLSIPHSPFIRLKESNVMYNPKITPLTINVGPAAAYHEPGQLPNRQLEALQNRWIDHQLIGRRKNCNRSCLVTLFLVICKFTLHKVKSVAWIFVVFVKHTLALS